MISLNPWIWLQATLTLMIFSINWRENAFYRIAEHLMIGVTAGYAIFAGLAAFEVNALMPINQGRIDLIIPIVIGLLLFTRFTEFKFLSRYPIAIIVGTGVGLAMRGMVEADIINQIINTTESLTGSPLELTSSIIVLLVVITTLVYFFFTVEHKGYTGYLARIGRLTMMIAFGYLFANAMTTRFTWLISRILFLLQDFLGLI